MGGERTMAEVSHLGPYRLLHRLGEGGMGVVHLGLDGAGRAVAIKVLRAHVAHDPDARARLAREVSSLRRVRHPQVAEVLDADVDGDQPYVVTRFVPGPGLDVVVKEQGPLAGARLTVLGQGLSQALGAIHAVGVVHRDLKPANVLLLDGSPVVIDFGIAHVADDVRLTSVGLVMGTPGYLSPEVIDGQPVSTATDWWGWAATLAFAASGRPPYGRGPMDVVIDRVRRGDCDLDGVDPLLRPLLHAALAVDPARRPAAAEVLAALDRYAAGEHATVTIPVGEPVTQVVPAPTQVVPAAGVPNGTQTLPTRPSGTSTWGPPSRDQTPVPDRGPAGLLEPFEDTLEYAERPLPGRDRRTGTLLALFAALAGVCTAWPVLCAIATALLMVLARTVERSTSALDRRRYERGVRRSDGLVLALTSPWHLVSAVAASAAALLLPLALGLATAFSAGLLITARNGGPSPAALPAVAAGGAVALLSAWWGPGGSALRRGSRILARAVVPRPAARFVVALLLLVGGVAALLAMQAGHAVWWPLQGLPFGLRLPGQ